MASRNGQAIRSPTLTLDVFKRMPPIPMSRATPIVFVIENGVSVRESLELATRCAGWRLETFASAADFLARPRVTAPSCLVLDVSLASGNGLDLQERITACWPGIPIIVIADSADVPMAVQAMKAGAFEFLTNPFSGEELVSAMQHAIERSVTALVDEMATHALRDRYTLLSSREREVMALVVSGLLNKRVAHELGISEITVKAHRGKVMRKMQADSLPDLVYMAMRLRVAVRGSEIGWREQLPTLSGLRGATEALAG